MKSFWNAIRDSLHHAPALVLATLCSVGIAFLWGSNIGALYPVVEMTLNGESIQSWLEKGAQTADTEAQSLQQQLAVAPPNLTQDERSGLERRVSQATRTRDYKLWLVSWADRILPRNPFQTICWIMGLLMVSTLIKHALMLTNELLIGHVSTSIVRDLRMRVFDSALAMDRKTYQAYGTSGLLEIGRAHV